MNFLPAELEGRNGEAPRSARSSFPRSGGAWGGSGDGARQVIAGLRPEDFEDASLVCDKRTG